MRVFTIVLGVIFLSFSVMQLNDPDVLLWVGIYMIPATASFVFTYRKQNPYLHLGLALIYIIGAIALFPPSIGEWIRAEEESSFGMKLPMIEEVRESMGLFLCFLTFLFYWIKSRTTIKKHA